MKDPHLSLVVMPIDLPVILACMEGTCILIFMQVKYGQALKSQKIVEISPLAKYISVLHMILLSNVTLYPKAPFLLWATSIHLVKTTTKMFIFLQALVFTELLVQVAVVTLAHWKRKRQQQQPLLPFLHLMQAVVGVTSLDICFCIFHPFCCF